MRVRDQRPTGRLPVDDRGVGCDLGREPSASSCQVPWGCQGVQLAWCPLGLSLPFYTLTLWFEVSSSL